MSTPGFDQDPIQRGMLKAVDRAERLLPQVHPSNMKDSQPVRTTMQNVFDSVTEERLSRIDYGALMELTSEAATLATMSREAFGEPQLDRSDVEKIKDFFKWILNGAVRRR